MNIRVFVSSFFILFFVVISISAKAEIVTSTWYGTYGLIYQGSETITNGKSLKVGDICNVTRKGIEIGTFTITKVSATNSVGKFKSKKDTVEFKSGDVVECFNSDANENNAQPSPTVKPDSKTVAQTKTDSPSVPLEKLLTPVAYNFQWVAESGYFLPNEGGLEGGMLFGAGSRYSNDKNTFFFDLLFSSTATKVNLPFLKGDVRNTLGQLGYMRNVGSLRLGGAIQYHSMNLNGIAHLSKTTFSFLGEYDITERAVLRVQTSAPAKKGTVHMGSNLIVLGAYKF